MHRIDISRATGRALVLTADHDGALVADIVEEWTEAHAAPFELLLTGVAGGSWSRGSGGRSVDLDAIEFCRGIAGRGEQAGRLIATVPF
jgi:hypothetical protein